MQNRAAQAYSNTRQQTVQPRDLEANLLVKAASKLQSIRDDWELRKDELNDALIYNRKLWTIFVSSASDDTSPLPVEIRHNIRNLGLFIFKQTVKIQVSQDPADITALININREIAAGLRAQTGSVG